MIQKSSWGIYIKHKFSVDFFWVAKNISNALRRACFHKVYPCFALNLGTTPKHDLLSDETRPNVQTFAGVGDELPNKLHTDPLLLRSNWVNMYRIYPAESCTYLNLHPLHIGIISSKCIFSYGSTSGQVESWGLKASPKQNPWLLFEPYLESAYGK